MPLRIAARLSQQKRDIFSDVPFLLDNKIKARCSVVDEARRGRTGLILRGGATE